MTPDFPQLRGALEVLTTEIRGLRSDVDRLREDGEDLRQEFRRELAQLRGDLALVASRHNSAIEDNKKKLPSWVTALSAFISD